jgi:predicted CXXCH cytochrome family protein
MKPAAGIGIIALAVVITAVGVVPSMAEEAADMFDCKVCHPMKIRDFKGRRANPVVPIEEFPEEPTGRQDIASSSGMCLSCHDGFVEDSRMVWKDGYRGHRLGTVPPGHIRSPELGGAPEFPLNEDGRMYCGTCHSAHLSEAEGAPTKVKPFMRASHQGGNVCQACHQDKQLIADSGHDKGSRRARDFERRGTCGTCHAPHGSEFPVMWARSRGSGNNPVDTFCRSCHEETPEPAEHPVNIVAWSQPLRQAVRSNAAAAMPVFDEHGSSAAVGSITCATCHDVHRERAEGRRDELPGLHLRMPEIVEPLCADCHGFESIYLYKFFHSHASRR